MLMANENVLALPCRTEPHFAVSLSSIAKCGDLQQGDIPGIYDEYDVLDVRAFKNSVTYSNQIVISAVMKAST